MRFSRYILWWYMRDRCLVEGVSFFFKQWGGWWPKAGGRELDGPPLGSAPHGRRRPRDGRSLSDQVFDGYVFSDLSEECIDSLERRIGPRPGVHIRRADANDPAHHAWIADTIPSDALVIAYLDPEGLHLHFDPVRSLAWRYRKLDLLVNLPVHQIYRALAADESCSSARKVLGRPGMWGTAARWGQPLRCDPRCLQAEPA